MILRASFGAKKVGIRNVSKESHKNRKNGTLVRNCGSNWYIMDKIVKYDNQSSHIHETTIEMYNKIEKSIREILRNILHPFLL